MGFAVVGACIDERSHQGFSAWRSACRAAGIGLESMLIFTIDLLFAASIGLFLGAMAMQFIAALVWHRPGGARTALAAHAGCALGMIAGLALCALLPVAAVGLAAPHVPQMLDMHGELAADAVEKQGVGGPSKPT